MEIHFVLIVLLLVATIVQYKVLSLRSRRIVDVKEKAAEETERHLDLIDRLAKASSFSTLEITEIMQEQQEVVVVDSDIWQAEMPYGKWAKFDDGSGRPQPEIRGFWYQCPGRLIGVKMPIGSEYDMHNHPWKETLIGVSGLVIVEIETESERTGKSISKHRLAPGDVVEIPPGISHAVVKAEIKSQLICIWGVPEKPL